MSFKAKGVETTLASIRKEDKDNPFKYDRAYLLKLRENAASQRKPKGLPDLDIILDRPWSHTLAGDSPEFPPTFFRPAHTWTLKNLTPRTKLTVIKSLPSDIKPPSAEILQPTSKALESASSDCSSTVEQPITPLKYPLSAPLNTYYTPVPQSTYPSNISNGAGAAWQGPRMPQAGPQAARPRERKIIEIKDQNTGKDLTEKLLNIPHPEHTEPEEEPAAKGVETTLASVRKAPLQQSGFEYTAPKQPLLPSPTKGVETTLASIRKEDKDNPFKYDRAYLLKLRENAASQRKPKGLPDLDIFLDRPWSHTLAGDSPEFRPIFFQPVNTQKLTNLTPSAKLSLNKSLLSDFKPPSAEILQPTSQALSDCSSKLVQPSTPLKLKNLAPRPDFDSNNLTQASFDPPSAFQPLSQAFDDTPKYTQSCTLQKPNQSSQDVGKLFTRLVADRLNKPSEDTSSSGAVEGHVGIIPLQAPVVPSSQQYQQPPAPSTQQPPPPMAGATHMICSGSTNISPPAPPTRMIPPRPGMILQLQQPQQQQVQRPATPPHPEIHQPQIMNFSMLLPQIPLRHPTPAWAYMTGQQHPMQHLQLLQPVVLQQQQLFPHAICSPNVPVMPNTQSPVQQQPVQPHTQPQQQVQPPAPVPPQQQHPQPTPQPDEAAAVTKPAAPAPEPPTVAPPAQPTQADVVLNPTPEHIPEVVPVTKAPSPPAKEEVCPPPSPYAQKEASQPPEEADKSVEGKDDMPQESRDLNFKERMFSQRKPEGFPHLKAILDRNVMGENTIQSGPGGGTNRFAMWDRGSGAAGPPQHPPLRRASIRSDTWTTTPQEDGRDDSSQTTGACPDPPVRPGAVGETAAEPQQRKAAQQVPSRSSCDRCESVNMTLQGMSVRSNAIFDCLQNRQEEDDNIFYFVAKRFQRFSSTTQEWLENEAMNLYMEAKRREKSAVSENCAP